MEPLTVEPSSPIQSSSSAMSASAEFTSELSELTKIVSPKVSELLAEQALALDTFLGGFDDDSMHSADGSMEDEWRNLEEASNDLRKELALATTTTSDDDEVDLLRPDQDDSDDMTNYDNTSKLQQQQPYTLADHAKILGVTRNHDHGLFSKPFVWHGMERNCHPSFDTPALTIMEYITPPKTKLLQKIFVGWNPGPREHHPEEDISYHDRLLNDPPSPPQQQQQENDEIPVRSVTIPIRPDVLCGAVMGSLTDTIERLGGSTIKRQGGHLHAILPGKRMRVYMPGEWETRKQGTEQQQQSKDNEKDESSSHSMNGITSNLFVSSSQSRATEPKYIDLPPYRIDSQLVTKKYDKSCHRLLLVRVFRIQDRISRDDNNEEEMEDIFDVPVPLDGDDLDDTGIDVELESENSVRALREAAALVQRIRAVGDQGFAIEPPPTSSLYLDESDAASTTSHGTTKSYLKSFGNVITSPIRYLSSPTPTYSGTPERHRRGKVSMTELMSQDLLRKCRASPSVLQSSKSGFHTAKLKSHGVFPSLSREDSPYVKASWTFFRECIRELDLRCLSYSTLATTPLFQFPALPTLDAHFIFQIKLMCRESMVVSLLKTASELEVYAREFELSCSNLEQLLRPTFDNYKIEPPPLPTPLPLTAYPFDFQPPEDVCPPWGAEVAKAMDSTAKEKTGDKSSFEKAEEAVLVTVCAFHRQYDREQGARLGRKNMQVMDRLAKMQAYKRTSIDTIKNLYGSNLNATNMADEFQSLCLKSSNPGSLSDTLHSTPEVPLLLCNVLVGNSAGTCYVTSSQILFITQLVPIIGGNRVHLFSLMDVDVTINPPSKAMLSPLPAGITLTTTVGKLSKMQEEVYSFIPSIGARRFAKFLEVVKDAASENPNTLKFSERGGLIYMYDENI